VERRLKERLTGAAVLILLAVIFIPMILDTSVQDEIRITESNIPPRPQPMTSPRPLPAESAPPVSLLPPAAEDRAVTDISGPESPEQTIPADIIGIPDSDMITQRPQATVAPSTPPAPTPPTAPAPSTSPAPTPPTTPAPAPAAAPAPPVPGPADTASRPTASALEAWVVQLGSFASQENASSLVQQLQKEGYPAFLEELKSSSGVVYRVRVGPEVLRADAEKIQENLRTKLKLEGIVLRYP